MIISRIIIGLSKIVLSKSRIRKGTSAFDIAHDIPIEEPINNKTIAVVITDSIRHYIAASEPQNEVAFTWQGGEPTLLGLDFYRRAVKLQAKYGAGRKISNSFQTNGVLLDDKWWMSNNVRANELRGEKRNRLML